MLTQHVDPLGKSLRFDPPAMTRLSHPLRQLFVLICLAAITILALSVQWLGPREFAPSLVDVASLRLPQVPLIEPSDAIPESTSHVEVEALRLELGRAGKIRTLAMNQSGQLLVVVTRYAEHTEDQETVLLTVDGEGEILAEWLLGELKPSAVYPIGDESVLVAARGRVVEFDREGHIKRDIDLGDVLDGVYADAHPSGLVADMVHIYVVVGNTETEWGGWGDIVRFDRQFGAPEVVVNKQFGCCSHIDIDLLDGVLLVAENSRHRVNKFSTDGKLLGRWGKRDRRTLEGFAACCNPVCFDIGSDGSIYTAESGVGRVKRFSADGEFLGVVGMVDTTNFDGNTSAAAAACYMPIEVTPDGDRVYVMDVRANIIRVLMIQDQNEKL